MADDDADPTAQPEPPAPDPYGTDQPRGTGPDPRRALGVETVITHEKGRWAVDIVVVFADGVVRHRIDDFATEARAKISANLIKRAAERELPGPLRG